MHRYPLVTLGLKRLGQLLLRIERHKLGFDIDGLGFHKHRSVPPSALSRKTVSAILHSGGCWCTIPTIEIESAR